MTWLLYRIVYVVQLVRIRLLTKAMAPGKLNDLWFFADPPLLRARNALTDAIWWLEKRS